MPIGFGLHLMSTILYQCVFLMGIGIERGDRLQSRTYILCLSMFWFWQRHITGMCLGIVRLGSSVWGPSLSKWMEDILIFDTKSTFTKEWSEG